MSDKRIPISLIDLNQNTQTPDEIVEDLFKSMAYYDAQLKTEADNDERLRLVTARSTTQEALRFNAPGGFLMLKKHRDTLAAQLETAQRELAAAKARVKELEMKQAEWETALSGLGQALFFFRHFDESTVFETAKRLIEEHKAQAKALEPFAGAANLLHEDTDETIPLCIFDGEDEYTSPLFIDKALIDALEVRHLRAARDALKGKAP